MTVRRLATAAVIAVTFLINPALASAVPNPALYAWGQGNEGQLGDGGGAFQASPEAVTLAPGVIPTAVAAGGSHSLAIGSDDKLYAWGRGAEGELGDGTTMSQYSPEVITLAPGVAPRVISAGWRTSFAIGSDGRLYAWGEHSGGKLGDGTTNPAEVQPTPEVIVLATGVGPRAISAGDDFTLAIGSDGNVYGWGANGAFGSNPLEQDTPKLVNIPEILNGNPVQVPFTATVISAGASHSMAIGSDGNLYGWGINSTGAVGDGRINNAQDAPELITLVPGVTPTAIAAGIWNSVAIGSDHVLYAWGYNTAGGVGDGNPNNGFRLTPEAITLAPGVTPRTISESSGTAYGLAIGSDGNLYGWGSLPTSGTQWSPIPIAPGFNPTVISGGSGHILAIGPSTVPPEVPEAPLAVGLPASAVALMAAVQLAARRRRRRKAVTA